MILYPSGSMISTVSDMGRFIAAHLNGGKYGDAQMISGESINEMHRQQFTQHPRMPGMAYGFFENFTNGRRVLFHTGLSGHQSILCFLPEEKTGFYLALSAPQGGSWHNFRTRFLEEFMKRYYPAPQNSPPITPPADFRHRSRRFAGTFRPHLLPRTTVETLGNFALDTPVADNFGRVVKRFDSAVRIETVSYNRGRPSFVSF